MRVVLSTIGKFHTFDLARELHKRDAFSAIFTGYPHFKLKNEQLPEGSIRSFPWFQTPYMAFPRRQRLGVGINRLWEYLSRTSFDAHVARHLPPCDVFVGLSSSALRSGRRAKAMGAKYVCDRGSSHIRVQEALLREEHDRWSLPYTGIDPRIMQLEEAEYAEADCITVPSTFNMRSFLSQGVPEHKLRRLPYGVNLSQFHQTGKPDPNEFNVLFAGGMSLRKGVPYLLTAYQQLQHPRKSLTFAGTPSDNLIATMKDRGLWPQDARVLGHVPQPKLKDLMSRSHVMVLPSIEEGLALVQAQAMACGCPVIGTAHTGSEDLFTDGAEGYIVPIRSAEAIASKLQHLADNPKVRNELSASAMSNVQAAGGWHEYGETALQIYQRL